MCHVIKEESVTCD